MQNLFYFIYTVYIFYKGYRWERWINLRYQPSYIVQQPVLEVKIPFMFSISGFIFHNNFMAFTITIKDRSTLSSEVVNLW